MKNIVLCNRYLIPKKGEIMKNKEELAIDILKKYSQEHIVQLIEKQSEDKKREEVIDKILSIDFSELEDLYEQTLKPLDIDTSEIEPVIALKKDKLSQEEVDSYIRAGRDVVIGNKFAVVTMAGGQGTRLRI